MQVSQSNPFNAVKPLDGMTALHRISQRALLEGRLPISHWPKAAQDTVDTLIAERAPLLTETTLGRIILKTIFRPLLSYRDAVFSLDAIANMAGHDIMHFGNRVLELDLTIKGLDNLPTSGGCIVVANHPSGLADGLAIHRAIFEQRPDLHIMANADALRIAPGLDDVIIPVEWVVNKRTTSKTRTTLKRSLEVLAQGRVLTTFPSGRIAYASLSGLRERPWMSACLALARRAKVPIVPVHIDARNSKLFYAISQIHNELRDITLFRETLNKKGQPYSLSFGPPVHANADRRDDEDCIKELQSHVENRSWEQAEHEQKRSSAKI